MIGTIERIKNNVLLKCSTLNDEIISKSLIEIINTRIYRFSEEMISLVGELDGINEEILRNKTKELIENKIVKKIKRKLFIDSLALQITNDSFIEDYVGGEISLDKLKKTYIKELENNKNSNQLNMTEDLNLNEIINDVSLFVDEQINKKISENAFLVGSVNGLVKKLRENLEQELKEMILNADNSYLNILVNSLLDEVDIKEEKEKEISEEEGEDNMFENTKEIVEKNDTAKDNSSLFEKYDDMTLFNKVILSLNTAEEKLSRKEGKLEKSKTAVEERLSNTNANIEANIERENKLSQRKLELNAREVELNSKLSEAEVIFLNMKPLIKGLNKIKDANLEGGNDNE